jgi:hypothetical protein
MQLQNCIIFPRNDNASVIKFSPVVIVVVVGAVSVVFFTVFSDVTNIHRDCDLANVAESSVDNPDWRLSRRGVGRRGSSVSRGRSRGAVAG